MLVPVGEAALAYLEGFDGEAHPVATPEEAGALLEEIARPATGCSIKGSRSVGLERVLALACSARSSSGARPPCSSACSSGRGSSSTCALKEFGQHIREEGPAGHHGKAGTPTMGGLAIFLSVCVPFLILSEYRAASLAVLGTALAMAALGFADDITKLPQAPLAGRLRADQAARPGAHGDRALARRHRVGRARPTRSTCACRRLDRPRLRLSVLIFLVLAGPPTA